MKSCNEHTSRLMYILRKCCKVTGCSILEAKSPKSTLNISLTRQLYCWFARRMTTATLYQIGEVIGRSHPSVIHLTVQAQKYINIKDSIFMNAYNKVMIRRKYKKHVYNS